MVKAISKLLIPRRRETPTWTPS